MAPQSTVKSLFFLNFYGHAHSIWKFPGQGLHLSWRCDLHHSCSNIRSFNPLCWARVTAVGFFFFVRLHTWLMEDPWLGVKSELQLLSTPQPGQHWIPATSVIYAAACSNTRPLTHWGRPEIKPPSSQTLCWVLNPLSHCRNTSNHFLRLNFSKWIIYSVP